MQQNNTKYLHVVLDPETDRLLSDLEEMFSCTRTEAVHRAIDMLWFIKKHGMNEAKKRFNVKHGVT